MDIEKQEIEKRAKRMAESDSLDWFIRQCGGNNYALSIAYKIKGKKLRDISYFREALNAHYKGLEYALASQDTNEIIQAYNNLGTNFRRMGILDEASNNHYTALRYCENWSDTISEVAKKNRVVSLNGIGNIHLTLGNTEIAMQAFSKALEGEKELGSYLGQAINYANIGSILEMEGETARAYICYQESMKFNRLAHSNLGIALCHNHLGRMAEKQKNWEEALEHYQSSSQIMKEHSDRWHWLEAYIAIARVYLLQNLREKAEPYIERSEQEALDIHSPEHLAEIYRLKSLSCQQVGNFREAISHYEKSSAYTDSVMNEKNKNNTLNLQMKYERSKAQKTVNVAQSAYRAEQKSKKTLLVCSVFFAILAITIILLLLYVQRIRLRTNRQLKRTIQMRSTFFTNITHEFRTPLTVVIGLAEQLKKGELGKKDVDDYLETIIRQSRNLLRLVNQLLDAAKSAPGMEQQKWVHADIVSYIRLVLDGYRCYLNAKHIQLVFTTQVQTLQVDYIPEYINKILQNLLGNAIKFVPEEGVIQVHLATVLDKQLILQISDNGQGISEEELPYIFDAFYQGLNNKNNTGTGIGLAFVKQMVESMNGSITAANSKEGGAEFTIRMSLQNPKARVEVQTDENESALNCLSKTDKGFTEANGITVVDEEPSENVNPLILIVEDNQDVSFYIHKLVEGKYRIRHAHNGCEALNVCNENMPDLIITDLMMPEMDGYTLCQNIRSSQTLNHIPIIITTAKSEETDRLKGIQVGAEAYLLKPFNADELLLQIENILNQRRILREKYSKALCEGNTGNVELRPADRDFLNNLTEFIHQHLAEKALNAEMVADKFCVSKSQLNRKIRAITNYSTTAYILLIRMEKAKRLLVSTEQPIGEIAMNCGFEDTSYFTRVFKQLFSTTPSLFRKTPQ
ncbi:response regulator [Mediterranea massiliensis]|uniref:hybrid sensor histidine kinase/response regulator transcription factor n=1 Tax=Mediterranea massiliensis TaxID=1841865 RepID=UPI00266B6EAD|nr:response regulator [Mediterranea massiliensis]